MNLRIQRTPAELNGAPDRAPASWTAAESEEICRFRMLPPGSTPYKAVSSLRFATAVQNLAEFGRSLP